MKVENAPFAETSPAKKMKTQHFRSAAGDMAYGFETALAGKSCFSSLMLSN